MTAATTAQQHVAGVDVLVDGAKLDPAFRDATIEVQVVNSLTLPDMALVRMTDPDGSKIDSNPLQIGKQLEIKAAAMGEQATVTIFKGDVVAIEPEFNKSGCVISVRAYDRAHKLNRVKKVRTWQQVKASDMASKIASENGLQGKVTSTTNVHEFFQQSDETDWDFLWRVALMEDYEVVVEDTALNFRPANKAQGKATTLKWQTELKTFRPRVSGVQQIQTVQARAWDPKGKKPVNGSASSATTTSKAGTQQSQVSSASGGGTSLLGDRVAFNAGEANQLAKSTLNRQADAFYEADGVAFGNPAIKAGSQVQIQGVGNKFGGTFTVSTATHRYRGATGYDTHFQISGRSTRTLMALVRPPQPRDWSASLVVGLVTNNNDPEQMGRVRVKYPSLSDSDESAWARIATPSAGNGRGLLMLPQVDEEVIVGFEHGDTRRPIVVGSLFNGRDKPGDELIQNKDGSFGLVSNEKIHEHSKKDFEIKSDQKLTIEVQSDMTEKVQGSFKNNTTGSYTVEGASTVNVKGANVTVEASGSLTLKGATVSIQGSGMVEVGGQIIKLG
jgi:phage protein D